MTLATHSVEAIEGFDAGELGFLVSDRVVKPDGMVSTCFMRSNHEHRTLACFLAAEQVSTTTATKPASHPVGGCPGVGCPVASPARRPQ